ncbi:excalibur calcium-binding domain-containing protein [Micromonospora rhizosphaerae]|uniref:excalibur calcium-binding domain-containing protein n=1 Tax=Micromonospora rhizosphaerae TaxID=568872 RepID=UPI001FDF8C83|nr:excalibur calcium-binding domain-containing protein [Micromonospora rhizosphaerae]
MYATSTDTKRKTLPWLLAGAAAVVELCCCGTLIMAANGLSPTAAPTASTTTPGNRFVDVIPNPSPSAAKPTTPTPPAAEETPADPATTVRTPPAKPTATRTSSPAPAPTTTRPKPPPPTTDPRFATCKEANAAGYGPYRRGIDPEYAWYRDPNDDGLVCERR